MILILWRINPEAKIIRYFQIISLYKCSPLQIQWLFESKLCDWSKTPAFSPAFLNSVCDAVGLRLKSRLEWRSWRWFAAHFVEMHTLDASFLYEQHNTHDNDSLAMLISSLHYYHNFTCTRPHSSGTVFGHRPSLLMDFIWCPSSSHVENRVYRLVDQTWLSATVWSRCCCCCWPDSKLHR